MRSDHTKGNALSTRVCLGCRIGLCVHVVYIYIYIWNVVFSVVT
ncbi:hypothetical protein N9L68_06375 [bacterium]|nr:hypothetical protein [bacterium]